MIGQKKALTSLICILFFSLIYSPMPSSYGFPEIRDPDLKIEHIVDIKGAIDMAFLGQNDILVAIKNTGEILRIVNGNVLPEPLLDLDVANAVERGLISMAVATNSSKTYVFTYHVQSGSKDDGDGYDTFKGIRPLGSIVTRFELMDNKLVSPKVMMHIDSNSLKAYQRDAHHVGGKIIIGPDKNLYIIVGDGLDHLTKAQNNLSGPMPDGTGGILRITQDGRPVSNPPLGDTYPLNIYYAYGIRNSIAIDFDPVSTHLWDAEAGADGFDELNLVVPGFNSGWVPIMGFSDEVNKTKLVNFDGRGRYMDPKLVWSEPVTPSAIKFLNSTNLGSEYENDLFVGRYALGWSNQATLYHFDLNKDRTELLLSGQLADKIVNTVEEDNNSVLVSNLGIVTDIEVGPDKNLYILQFSATKETSNNTASTCIECGAIYKISAKDL